MAASHFKASIFFRPRGHRPTCKAQPDMAEGQDQPAQGPPSDVFQSQLEQFLNSNGVRVSDIDNLVEYLKVEMGAWSMDDLVELTENDLADERAGMKPLHRRKFLTAIKTHISSATSIEPRPKSVDSDHCSDLSKAYPVDACLDSDSSSSTHTFEMESEPFSTELELSLHTTDPPIRYQMSMVVEYIHCKDIFLFDCKRKIILNLDPFSDTLDSVCKLIASQVQLPKEMTLELYFAEGYPLDVNPHTIHEPLCKWGISNKCLLYTFARPSKQSGVRFTVSDALGPSSTQSAGNEPNSLLVRSHLFGVLQVRTDAANNTINDIKKKIQEKVHIHPELFDLYTCKGSLASKVEDDMELLMYPKQYYQLYDGTHHRAYGACTYQPAAPQTEAGLAKFYSCLFYMAKEFTRELKSKILSYVDREYGCPPLSYALMCLFELRSLKNLGSWVALVEGLFQLFYAILCIYCEVPHKKVFEFSDYIWSLIITEAEKCSVESCARCAHETLSLNCRISETRMMDPVCIQDSKVTYEKDNVLKKIESNEGIEGCAVSDLSEKDLTPNEMMKRLLMCNMFRNLQHSDVIVWTDPSRFFKDPKIGKVSLPSDYSLTKFECLHKEMKIVSPKELYKSPGNTCLTSYKKGFTAVSLGPAKTDDSGAFVFYNPLYKPEKNEQSDVTVTSSTISTLKPGKPVELKNYLSAKVRAGNTSLHSPFVSFTSSSEQEYTCIDEITREPYEAIIVTLDVSTSMKKPIFAETGKDYSRSTAAEHLFDAFVNRTLAYHVQHVVGLVTFASNVEVRLHLTEALSMLPNELRNVQVTGNTALYDAIVKACDLLECVAVKFPSCKRRILCLTDGDDNKSRNKPQNVIQMLKTKNIVVDTVLITGSAQNSMLKAISFASGGFCFFPKTMAEAMKVFEIEPLVSIRQRPYQEQREGTLDQLRALAFTPTDPYGKEEFQSGMVQTVKEARFTTAQKITQDFILLGIGASSTTSAGSSNRTRRLMKELRQYHRDPHPSVDVFPNENIALWKMVLVAPDNTPYERGTFVLYAKFPAEYPLQPPEVRFITPIYHCNINSSGRICHSSLDNHYVPTMTVKEIINYIYGLLMDPEPADPLDSVLALQLREDRATYEAKARELTGIFATVGRDELIKQIVGEEGDVPPDLVCPLSKQLFTNPVTTIHGHTYDKEALLAHVQTNGSMDPIALKPIDPSMLVPNNVVKNLVETWKHAQKSLD